MSDKSPYINKLTALLADKGLEREYQAYSSKMESRRERGILYFAIWLYAAYSVLDLMVLDKAAVEAVCTRMVLTITAFGMVYATKFPAINKYFQFVAASIMCIGAFSISFFIWREGTINPPYYVGIIVVVLVFSALVRAYFLVSLASLFSIFGSYVWATASFAGGTEYIASLFFLTHSLILCTSVVHVLEMKRRKEFLQHRETDMLNQQLQKMVDDATLSLKRKNAILNILTHILRTPLHQIIGYSQILETETLGKQQHPEYVEYSAHIHRAGQNLLRIVQRLMKYSRLEAGTIKPVIQGISSNELIDCAKSGVAARAADQNVRIEHERTRIQLAADCGLMEAALIEILANAIDASPAGSIVNVWAERHEDKVSLLVADNGPGIDNQQLNSIRNSMEMTEDFLSVSESLSLGVTLTEKIVALHKGRMDIRHGEDGGTVVEIMLPAHVPKAKKSAATEQAPETAPAGSRRVA